EDVPKIRAEMLVVLASEDERVNATWPGYEAALKKAGVRYSLYRPPGTQHGFHNDTTPRYDEAAAREAGGRARIDPGILEEVNALVEWPKAVLCSFEREFLA
ncbi:glycine--tRNA ligase subunit beta, partial [Salmonella sp. s55055]|uniref:glycine--tRNA ligase subunit beta n=1 Tax=Salmonella sp. s55055 TaxID=3159678 RepID=UPI00397EAD02